MNGCRHLYEDVGYTVPLGSSNFLRTVDVVHSAAGTDESTLQYTWMDEGELH